MDTTVLEEGKEIWEDYEEKRKAGFIKAMEFKKKGGKIAGCLCAYTPVEILEAAGMASIGLCGTSQETIPDAERVLPKTICPLIKSTYGFALTKKCPYTYFSDIIIGETTCDGKKKMYELLAKHKDVHVLQLPNMTGGKSLELFTDELRKFRKVLEQKFNTKITDEALLDAVQIYNEERKVMMELLELGKLNPMPVAGSEIHQISFASDFIYDKREKLKMIRAYIAAAKKMTPPKTRKKRIIITGCPSGGVYEKVIKQIEELGADVVAFENCSGTKGYQNQVRTKGDLVANIAERYLKIPCSVMYQNDARSDIIKEFIREYQADGVIDVVLSGCHTYAIETNKIKEASREAGANYMSLETDYSKQDVGQIRTRLEAFIELL